MNNVFQLWWILKHVFAKDYSCMLEMKKKQHKSSEIKLAEP